MSRQSGLRLAEVPGGNLNLCDMLGVRARYDAVSRDLILEKANMAKGTLKWFDPAKGYGFIQPVGGGKDVFVHISAVERAGKAY